MRIKVRNKKPIQVPTKRQNLHCTDCGIRTETIYLKIKGSRLFELCENCSGKNRWR